MGAAQCWAARQAGLALHLFSFDQKPAPTPAELSITQNAPFADDRTVLLSLLHSLDAIQALRKAVPAVAKQLHKKEQLHPPSS